MLCALVHCFCQSVLSKGCAGGLVLLNNELGEVVGVCFADATHPSQETGQAGPLHQPKTELF